MMIHLSKNAAEGAAKAVADFLSVSRGEPAKLSVVALRNEAMMVASSEHDRTVVPLQARIFQEGEATIEIASGLDLLGRLTGGGNLLARDGDLLMARAQGSDGWDLVGAVALDRGARA